MIQHTRRKTISIWYGSKGIQAVFSSTHLAQHLLLADRVRLLLAVFTMIPISFLHPPLNRMGYIYFTVEICFTLLHATVILSNCDLCGGKLLGFLSSKLSLMSCSHRHKRTCCVELLAQWASQGERMEPCEDTLTLSPRVKKTYGLLPHMTHYLIKKMLS